MSEHQLDWHLRNLSHEELRYVIALLRHHAGLRAEYVNPGSWGVDKRRGAEIEAAVEQLIARLRNPPPAARVTKSAVAPEDGLWVVFRGGQRRRGAALVACQ